MKTYLKHYDQDHLKCIALPLGGIGTGTVSLGGRGDLRDWGIVNTPAKGFCPNYSFFALWAKKAGEAPATRVLEGPVEPPYESSHGFRLSTYGLPRFSKCSFDTTYPFGAVSLSDRKVPLRARIEAFNPFVPGDADASGIPLAVFRIRLANPGAKRVDATVCGSLQNFIGFDGVTGDSCQNENEFKKTSGKNALQGLNMTSRGVPSDSEQYGTMALATLNREPTTFRTAWKDLPWAASLEDFWKDLASDGVLGERKRGNVEGPQGSLGVRLRIPPGSERTATFLLAWHYPNRMTWMLEGEYPTRMPRTSTSDESAPGAESDACPCENQYRVGNYYATRYRDAWDVLEKTAPKLKDLEARTEKFVNAFCNTDLPLPFKEAALFNLSTLRTQTCFRTEDGRFFGWEGTRDTSGCCPGSCTHVWNYEQATAYLFGDLSRSMRETEFRFATTEEGRMSFRAGLPLAMAAKFSGTAADGQMGCIMKLYRDWQLSGDEDLLKQLWPKARKALAYAWKEEGWDADQDGVMEGVQHNTTDLDYFGPNPMMAGWYLGALRAAEEMAKCLEDEPFAEKCRDLFERGRRWVDKRLFNGEWYEQIVRFPENYAPEHKTFTGIDTETGKPINQMGPGCQSDQLVGQFMSDVCNLGDLLERKNVRKTLRSIVKYNFRRMAEHANPVRAFALNDERGLIYGSYPNGNAPDFPCFRFGELWTGVEYMVAAQLIYENRLRDAERIVEAIRSRFDGAKRNPYNEAECGNHYARAMASWALNLAYTGFYYSAIDKSMEFTHREGTWFWSNGVAWGTCTQKKKNSSLKVRLELLHGELILSRFRIKDMGERSFKLAKKFIPGQSTTFTV